VCVIALAKFGSGRQHVAAGFWSSYHRLLNDVVAVPGDDFAPLRTAIGDLTNKDEDLAPKKHGFNIEGMAADPEGKALLIGRALVCRTSCVICFTRALGEAHILSSARVVATASLFCAATERVSRGGI